MRILRNWKPVVFALLLLGLSACTGPQPVCDSGLIYDPAANTCVPD